jgi:hypothetical protein
MQKIWRKIKRKFGRSKKHSIKSLTIAGSPQLNPFTVSKEFEMPWNITLFDETGKIVDSTRPTEQGVVTLNASAYAVDESNSIQIQFNRAGNLTQRVQVDWSIVNVSVTSSVGSVTFESGETSKTTSITGGAVTQTEVGTLQINTVTALTYPGNPPSIGSPSTASFTVNETSTPAFGPLATCTNLGTALTQTSSTGVGYAGYPFGTVYLITPSMTIAQINALNPSPGDAVLFQAGNTWQVLNYLGSLYLKSGVTYGRYGSGGNPVISAFGLTVSDWPTSENWRGVVAAESCVNTTVDGLDVRGSPTIQHTAFRTSQCSGLIVRRMKVYDAGGGLTIGSSTNSLVEFVEVTNAGLIRPNEAISITSGSDGYTIRYVWSHDNGKACIDNKGNCKNGEIYGSEFSATRDDPVFYLERCDGITVHDNWIHQQSTLGSEKSLMSIGVEALGDPATQYCRNIEIYNNVIAGPHRKIYLNFWIKEDVASTVTTKIANIHFHHNTIYKNELDPADVATYDKSWYPAVSSADNRNANATDLDGNPISTTPDPNDWVNLVIENNIIYGGGDSTALWLRHNTAPRFTIRNNVYQINNVTDPVGYLGTNAVFSSSLPVVDVLNDDFTPTGAALGAATDGGDCGAKVTWTCGL